MSLPSRRARVSIALIVVGGFVVPAKVTHAESTPTATVSSSTSRRLTSRPRPGDSVTLPAPLSRHRPAAGK